MNVIYLQEIAVEELSSISGGVSVWEVFISIFIGKPVDLLPEK